MPKNLPFVPILAGCFALFSLVGCSSSPEALAAVKQDQPAANSPDPALIVDNTAVTQPVAAQAASSDEQDHEKSPDLKRAENVIKMIIGLNHLRCAEIVNVKKMEDTIFDVTCIRKFSSDQRVHYAVDAANNAVVGVQ